MPVYQDLGPPHVLYSIQGIFKNKPFNNCIQWHSHHLNPVLEHSHLQFEREPGLEAGDGSVISKANVPCVL